MFREYSGTRQLVSDMFRVAHSSGLRREQRRGLPPLARSRKQELPLNGCAAR
jgi:hypothetical protein